MDHKPNKIDRDLQRLADEDEIDQRLLVVKTHDWLALLSILIILIALAAWAFLGSISITLSGRGVFLEKSIYGFVPLEQGQKIHSGDLLLMEITGIDKSRYGYLKGRVTEVNLMPVGEKIGAIVPKEFWQALGLNHGVPMMGLKADPDLEPGNESGMKWTSTSGPPYPISEGSLGNIQVIVERVRPIDYVIPLKRE